jgi:hypothetical protein
MPKKRRKLIDKYPLGLTRSGLVMVIWGLLLIGAGIFCQWVSLPYPHGYIVAWLIFTVAGLSFQGWCQLKYEPVNFYVWLGAMLTGWLFTLYVVYMNAALYSEIAPVWFVLLALAYAHTGLIINKQFYILAGLHLLMALLFEIGWRHWWGITGLNFLIAYGTVAFGLMSGLGLIIGAFLPRGRIRRKVSALQQPQTQTPG